MASKNNKNNIKDIAKMNSAIKTANDMRKSKNKNVTKEQKKKEIKRRFGMNYLTYIVIGLIGVYIGSVRNSYWNPAKQNS